ncbi:putative colanic acid biosynthesis acetyltransferase [Flavihumibacter sp.]|uniref:putative colanic acid biosynthesis acetyltransferase n=1 Tax=Flavihumibacter sp. TaxID=1913981 RepID=UPI002FC85D2A
MKTDLSSYNNSWYAPTIGASRFKQFVWYYFNAFVFATQFFPISGIKVSLLRFFGAKIGKGLVLKPSVNIKYPWKLTIGDYCWIGENVWIDNLTEVVIGNNVCISQGAMLLTGNHDYSKSTFDLSVKSIYLDDGVWIGAHSVVCPGVTCQSHAVLAVGSVATKNLEPYTVYQGNPALPIKERIIPE